MLRIDGKIYDVRGFIHEHPGGDSLLLASAERDMSVNFHAYHPRDVNISDYPSIRQVGEYTEVPPRFTYDHLGELKRRVYQHLRHSPYRSWHRLYRVMWVLLIWCGLYCVWLSRMNVVSSICLGLWAFPTAANLYHTQSHRPDQQWSTSRYFWDLLGASTEVWKYQHNVLHHQYVNTPDDPDVAAGFPLLRFHETQLYKWYHQFQFFYVLPLYTLTHFGILLHNLVVTLAPSVVHHMIPTLYGLPVSKRNYIVTRVPYFCIFFGIPIMCMGHEWSVVLTMYVLFSLVIGFVAGLFFAASHISSKIDRQPKDPCLKSVGTFIAWQSSQSVNIHSDSLIANVLFGGLNQQIEHHLLPSLDNLQLYHVSGIVRTFLCERGLAYNDCSLYDAIRMHLERISQLANHE